MKDKMPEKKSTGKRVVRIMIAAVLIVALVSAGSRYVNDYYRATDVAKEAMKGSEGIQVAETKGYYRFESGDMRRTDGIIFYPGGKVEETAYAPLLSALAQCGYRVYLIRMPYRLAVLNKNAADSVMREDTGVTDWIMMGHSLGGAMAASYAAGHKEQVESLVLLAAYSTSDLKESGVRVLSLYGSEDGVMNREKYEKYQSNLPEDAIEEIIDGGNHAGFGYYGEQKGDNDAQISREEQQEVVIDAIMAFCGGEKEEEP